MTVEIKDELKGVTQSENPLASLRLTRDLVWPSSLSIAAAWITSQTHCMTENSSNCNLRSASNKAEASLKFEDNS